MADEEQERVELIRNRIVRIPSGRTATDDLVKRSAAWLNRPRRQDLVSDVAHSQIGHDVRLRSGAHFAAYSISELLRIRQIASYHGGVREMHVSLSRRHLPKKVSHHITDDENPTAGRFSLDGRTFITCTSSGHVQLYDVEGRRLVLTKSLALEESLNIFKGNAYVYMSASPDGEFVAFTSKNGKRIYVLDFRQCDPGSNPIQLDLPKYNSQFHGGLHWKRLNLSYNLKRTGQNLSLMGSRSDALFVHDVTSNTRIEFKAHDDCILSTCYESLEDGTLLCSTGDKVLRVWDRRRLSSLSNKPDLEFYGHQTRVYGMSARGDGRYLISSSEDSTVKLWDMRRPSSHPNTLPDCLTARFSPHDTSIMTYGDKHPDNTWIVSGLCGFSPLHTTGQQFIYAESNIGSCAIYDLLTGAVVRELVLDGKDLVNVVRDISWHPYIDNYVAVTGVHVGVHLWE